MTSIACIFARGGSKGLPGKNIRLFHGKPLLAWSIECAKQIPSIDRILISTDSSEIAEVASQYGAEVPFLRPSELAKDDSPELLSWQHMLNYLDSSEQYRPSTLISLPATSPLRLVSDVKRCLILFQSSDFDGVISVTPSSRNPYFNMVQQSSDNQVRLVSDSPNFIHRRQDAPPIFDVLTLAYVFNTNFVLNTTSLFEGSLGAVQFPPERSIDIDTLLDFEIAEFLFPKYCSLSNDV